MSNEIIQISKFRISSESHHSIIILNVAIKIARSSERLRKNSQLLKKNLHLKNEIQKAAIEKCKVLKTSIVMFPSS